MQSVCISKQWYDEIKDRVALSDPFEFHHHFHGDLVEVDVVSETDFDSVSRELGWVI